jgi:phage/plasmid-like protein (TIGR03299 family)
MTAAVEKMAYVGETPWHGLGTQFAGNESIDEWAVAAGFGWDAIATPLKYAAKNALGESVDVALKSHRLLVRSDTQTELGVVSKDYKVVQPKRVIEFFRDIAFSSNSRYKMETAGVLFDGKRVWALAKTSEVIRVMGTDVIKPYILLGTSYDGSTATFATYTSTRVVCNNTLSMAVGPNGERANIRISHLSTFDEAAVKAALGLIENAEGVVLHNFEETATQLAVRKVDDKEMFNYFAKLYGPAVPEGKTVKDLTIGEFTEGQKRSINDLIALFKVGPGANLRSAEGTSWGLVNAVTRFEDARAGLNEKRFASVQFGAGAARKRAAVNEALALAA